MGQPDRVGTPEAPGLEARPQARFDHDGAPIEVGLRYVRRGNAERANGLSVPTIRTAIKRLVAVKLIIPMGKSSGVLDEPLPARRRLLRSAGRPYREGAGAAVSPDQWQGGGGRDTGKNIPVSPEAEPSIPVKTTL